MNSLETTLEEDYCNEIGAWLIDLRENEQLNSNPKALPPVTNIYDAYKVLSGTCKVKSTLGDHVGWKCGACDKKAWTSLGLTEPFRAPLHRYRMFQQSQLQEPIVIPFVLQKGILAVEAEFAFIIGKNLFSKDAPFTEKELWDAVDVVIPSLEVCGTRWSGEALKNATGFQKIVDFGLNQCCVLGPVGVAATTCQKDLDNVQVQIFINDKHVGTGSGKNVLGNPILALGWLASNLNSYQESTNTHVYGGGSKVGLLKGDVVMSGATIVLNSCKLNPGDVVRASFQGIGEVSLRLECQSPSISLSSTLSLSNKSLISTKKLENIATEAFVYLYPLVMMDVTRIEQLKKIRFINDWRHSRSYPPGHFKLIVRPNFDTLYSVMWLDLSDCNMLIKVPNTNGRYYCMHMMDMWTESFAVPGSRTWGTEANACILTYKRTAADANDDEKKISSNCTNVIESPTPYVWIINRIQTNGEKDYAAVHTLQDRFSVSAMNGECRRIAVKKASPTLSKKKALPPYIQLKNMKYNDFFQYAAKLLSLHPPHQSDGSILLRLQSLGFFPGRYNQFDVNNLSKEQLLALKIGANNGRKRMKPQTSLIQKNTIINGWDISVKGIGNYGNDYHRRATIAMSGLGAVPAEDAVYSSHAKSLSSNNKYQMHFLKKNLPPCDAFWSITIYDEIGFPVPNKWNKYSIGSPHSIKFETDGTLILYFQRTSPGIEYESNWLPTPQNGKFSLVGRYYEPREEILNLTWKIPPVIEVGKYNCAAYSSML
jgi:2-keto-4-pentenoate hydratase